MNVGSRTLRAGTLATLGTALFFLYGIYLPNLQRSASSTAAAHPVHAPVSGFAGKPGGGYYVRLHVADPPAAEGMIARILEKSQVLQAKGPYSGRYCIRATPKQITALMSHLSEAGDYETVPVTNRPWWFEDPLTDPNACSVMLDLYS